MVTKTPTRLQYLLVFGILLLSLWLRLYKIGLSSYWIDEMVSLHIAKQSNWKSVFWDNCPPLYHLILKVWVQAFGFSEFATRGLSVLFSVTATGVMIFLGFELRGVAGALVLGLLHALSSMSIAYAQEARMYALFEMLMAFDLLFFIQLLLRGKSSRGFFVTAILLSFTHYLAIIPLTIEAVFLWLQRNNWGAKRRDLFVTVLARLCTAFFIEVFWYVQFFSWDGLKWQRLKFSFEPYSKLPLDLVADLVNRSWFFGIAATAVLIALFARVAKRREKRLEYLYLFTLTVTPFFVGWIALFIMQRAVFLPRYFIYLVPAFSTLMAVSVIDFRVWARARDSRRWMWQALPAVPALLILVGTVLNLRLLYLPHKEPWRSVAEVVRRDPRPYILTTRTAAIRTPYFEQSNVEIEKWDPSSPNAIDHLVAKLRERKSVWIIENFWGGFPYMPKLGELLKTMKFDVSELSLKTEESLPVLVMRVQILSTPSVPLSTH